MFCSVLELTGCCCRLTLSRADCHSGRKAGCVQRIILSSLAEISVAQRPFLCKYGTVFYGEPLTLWKCVCIMCALGWSCTELQLESKTFPSHLSLERGLLIFFSHSFGQSPLVPD